MKRTLQIGSLALLVAGACFGDRQASNTQPPPSTPPAPANKPVNKAGLPKKGAEPIPRGAPRLLNPNPASALFRMSPEEREHSLEKLANEKQRENFRKELAWFDSLPKQQQENQLRRLDRFAQLTPEQRAEVKGLIVEANNLPAPRANAVRIALYRLQQMTDQQREEFLQRPAFQKQFSPEEFRIITTLADAWMGPAQ
jgi:hypothetical protein